MLVKSGPISIVVHTPLNWSDEQFFDFEHKFIQCSLHGALFEPLDGLCVWGPCLDKSLQSIPVELVDQQVIIYI